MKLLIVMSECKHLQRVGEGLRPAGLGSPMASTQQREKVLGLRTARGAHSPGPGGGELCLQMCGQRGPGQGVRVAEGGGPGRGRRPAVSPEPELPLTLGYVGTSRRAVSFFLSTKLYLQGQLVLQGDSQDELWHGCSDEVSAGPLLSATPKKPQPNPDPTHPLVFSVTEE